MAYDFNTAFGKVQSYAQGKPRALTQDEWNQVGMGFDPSRTDYTDQDITTANQRIDAFFPVQNTQITKTKTGPMGEIVQAPGITVGPNAIAPTQQPTPQPGFTSTPMPAPPPTQDAVNTGVWAKLQEILNRKPGYDPNAPENRLRLDVNRVGNQRAADRKRSAAAERLTQQGFANAGSGGALDTAIGQILNEQGMADTSFEAELARDSIDRDRSEMMQALGIGAGLTGQSQGDKTRMELAQLDAALRREGLSLQKLLGTGQLGNNLLALLLNSQLGYDKLGFDYANLLQGINRDSFLFAGG